VGGCNSFNANVGGGVTALDAHTQDRASVVAVPPPANCEKIFEQILTVIEQAVRGDCRGNVLVRCDRCDRGSGRWGHHSRENARRATIACRIPASIRSRRFSWE
jgi:hypothetical protein